MTASTSSARLHAATESPYVLASVDTARSPIDTDEPDWYRYVIRHGDSEIVGHRRGSAESVRQSAEVLVLQLNSRLHLKSGRVQLTIGPVKKS